MPEMTSHAPYPLNYTEGRDSSGHHLGLVNPGDIRDLDKAPDQHWHLTTDEDRAALAAQDEDGESGSEDEAVEPAPEPGEPAAPEPETPEQYEPGE